MRVGVEGQVPQRGFEDQARTWRAGIAFTSVARKSVERGDPDLGVGIVDHRDELTHGLCVDQVIEETATALTDGRILVMQASADGLHRVLTAPQQLVIGRDSTLRVAQARDESFVVGPDESEHDLSFQPYGNSRQRDFDGRPCPVSRGDVSPDLTRRFARTARRRPGID